MEIQFLRAQSRKLSTDCWDLTANANALYNSEKLTKLFPIQIADMPATMALKPGCQRSRNSRWEKRNRDVRTENGREKQSIERTSKQKKEGKAKVEKEVLQRVVREDVNRAHREHIAALQEQM